MKSEVNGARVANEQDVSESPGERKSKQEIRATASFLGDRKR